MKYLVHLRPSREFSDLIQNYRANFSDYITKMSKNVLHTTLMTIYLDPANEERVIQTLEGLTWEEFDIEPENLDLFDENSLVVRIKKTHDLMGFHRRIIEALKEYINWDENPEFNADEARRTIYDQFGSPYYAEFYNPHVAIAQVNPEIFNDKNFNADHFRGKRWKTYDFYLSKREVDRWETVRKFSHR